MAQQDLITLELRTSQDSEHTALAMEQVLHALPAPPSGIQGIWKQAPTAYFEILSQGQVTYFLLTIPREYLEFFQSQVTAAYPQVLINVLKHNPLFEFTHAEAKVSIGQLKLTESQYFSLKTTAEFSETDPLSSILSTLSKTVENDSVLIQFALRKAKKSWKSSSQTLVQQGVKQADGSFTAHPERALIEQKITQTGLTCSIFLLTKANTLERSKQLLDSLYQAFQSYSSAHNSLKLHTPLFGKNTSLIKIASHLQVPKSAVFSVPEIATMYHLPNKALSTIRNIAWGKNLLGEPPEDLPFSESIPDEERDFTNLFASTEYKNQERIFGIRDIDRRRHMYVIGKSGTGKSTLLANMIINDLKHDKGVAVIDPHGDLIDTVINYIPKRRINDVIIFDPTDLEAVVKLNLFEGGSVVHRELIASGIVAIFQKLYAHSWGPRLEYILRNTLLTLLERNAVLEDVLKMLTDKGYRDKVVESLEDPVLKNFWVSEFNAMQDRQRNEAIAPILNKVGQFVTSPLVRGVVNSRKSTFSIEEVMDEGKILLVNLSQGKLGEDNTALIGAMMITKIQLAAMNRVYMEEDKRRDFYLYIDEFQNFATTSFIKILSEARKYHLNLTLANQYIDQIPDEIKSAIFGNVGTMASFILGARDADWMNKEFGNRYTAEDLVSLARYQIILRLMVNSRMSNPFPANTLSLAKSFNQNKETVLRVSRERWAKKRE